MRIKYLSDIKSRTINNDQNKRVGMLNSGSAKALMNLSVHGFIGA